MNALTRATNTVIIPLDMRGGQLVVIFPLICQRLVNARERERERERESCRLNRISLTDLPQWQMFPFSSMYGFFFKCKFHYFLFVFTLNSASRMFCK